MQQRVPAGAQCFGLHRISPSSTSADSFRLLKEWTIGLNDEKVIHRAGLLCCLIFGDLLWTFGRRGAARESIRRIAPPFTNGETALPKWIAISYGTKDNRKPMATDLESVTFDGVHCAIELRRISHSLILMRMSGSDTGELHDAPMRTLDEWLAHTEAVEFFIDARKVRGASIDVSSDWAAWFTAHREQFKSITMLTGNKFIQITAEFVRRFAGLNGIMWVCTDARVFDLALEQAQKR